MLLLGCLAGPVQPLAAELAVEVTYPDGDENTIVALMQTAGNGIGAGGAGFLALQRFYRARTTDYQLRVEYLVLALLNALATGYSSVAGFTAPSGRCALPTSRDRRRAPRRRSTTASRTRRRRSCVVGDALGGLPADRVPTNGRGRTGTGPRAYLVVVALSAWYHGRCFLRIIATTALVDVTSRVVARNRGASVLQGR